MTVQVGGGSASGVAGGVLSGTYPSPAFASNGTTAILGAVTAALGANVVMTNANQYYDGPSVALTAGSWVLIGAVSLDQTTTAAPDWTAKLWDGVTAIASALMEPANGFFAGQLTLGGVVTLAAPTTYKLSVASNATGSEIRAAARTNSAGNTASWLMGLRVG